MKRALIVDDSRSARVLLSRMLESYDLQVDTCESAEQALEHLQHSHADVVFMDHLMPGMDGFQAVQAIKNNPGTATIPVVMYTSQEGELYLSQARALGAVGVLPKTINQSDVSRVLYQLRLLPERRQPASEPAPGQEPVTTSAAAAGIAATAAAQQLDQACARPAPAYAHDAIEIVDPHTHAVPGELEVAIRTAVAPLLKEHGLEMRRLMLAGLETLARRIDKQTREHLQHLLAAPGHFTSNRTLQDGTNRDPAAQPHHEAGTIRGATMLPVRQGRPLAPALTAVALLLFMVLGLMQWRTQGQMRAAAQSNIELAGAVAKQSAYLQQLRQTLDEPVDADSTLLEMPWQTATARVPYGEAPLAGARLERLREMITTLKADGFKGRLRIATFTGEFCLTGNSTEGYSLAADDTPLKRCDLVGNPFEDGLSTAQHQSVAFANLIASMRQETTALTVDIHYEGRQPAVPYPDSSRFAQLSAGEWNRIAAQNNRVEFQVLPTGS